MITVYKINPDGFYGGSKEIDPAEGVDSSWTYSAPPTDICKWVDCNWVPYDNVPPYLGTSINLAALADQNAKMADSILTATDWASIPAVADPAQSNPYLTNQNAWLEYRSAIRNIAVNTPEGPVDFPEQPPEIWSN